jgi:hypothetical protein
MTSIGYNYLYGSVGPTITLNINGLSKGFIAKYGSQVGLGGGIPGFSAQNLINTEKGYEEYMDDRDIVVESWNTNYLRQKISGSSVPAKAVTPFRAINNAGDLLSRKYYSCGGPCQTFQSRPGMFGLKTHFGAIAAQCDGSGVEPASCNTKYVYDSSDYSRYLKQRAINKNYNALTNGGNSGSGSQVAWRAIRRY